jgi:hypothetical protein
MRETTKQPKKDQLCISGTPGAAEGRFEDVGKVMVLIDGIAGLGGDHRSAFHKVIDVEPPQVSL